MTCRFDERRAPATAERVTREANLIARNLACHGDETAAAETADHVGRFWAPLLRATLLEQARAHPERFSPVAKRAIAILARADATRSVDFRMQGGGPAA